MTGLLESVGAQPKNPSRGKPITPALRFETGLFTNRSPLHDPSQWVYSHFYGGYQDTLFDGLNMEISNQLSLIKRPGLSEWSNQVIVSQPNWVYDWRTLDLGVKVVLDTTTDTEIVTPTTKTTIFTKSAGAGQGYYQGVADTLYYGDGVDLQKYILPGGAVWNWGIEKPTTAPTTTITPSGSASTQWVALTEFTTMGLLTDSNGNVQQLISVNAKGTNSTQLGTTGNGQPAWNQTPGGTTVDNAWNWTNFGPIVLWTPNTTYNNASTGGTLVNPCIIYDPTTKCCFINGAPALAQGTSGTSKPNFSSGFHSIIHDGTVKWFQIGALNTPPAWQPAHSYLSLTTGVDQSKSSISEPVDLTHGLPSNQTVFWQVNDTGSTQTSGAGGAAPNWSTVAGTQTFDNDLIWMCLGSGTRQTVHGYNAWTAQNTSFSVIVDSNSNYQVCTTSGISSATATGSISWATGYGQTTVDGSVTWTCIGGTVAWAASTQWFLPSAGWFPPSGSVAYGGAGVVDSNSNDQFVINSGKSGGVAPTWSVVVGGTTTDSGVTWIMTGPFSTQGFSWTKSITYAYSYTSRTADDIYNTIAPPDWPSALGPPTGAGTGHVSTASPITQIIGPNPGAVVTLTGLGSTDPQVDTITIWRTLDGGSTLFFLTEIPNPPAIGGIAQPWTVKDSQPDTVINELIQAPINDQNDPPPAGFLPMAYHFERIWGAVGNFVFCSGGGDVLTGNPNESFDPEDFFEFPSTVTKIVPTATGILVFLTSDVYAILGGPIFDTFFPSPMVPGVGLLHYNALDIHGGVIYLFTADAQLISFDPSGGAQRMGGPIADKLQLFDSTKAYVTCHEAGNDNAIFVGDGATGWFRLNPSQFPNGSQVWSPFGQVAAGAGFVQSVEVSTGVHRLLIGGIGSNTHILQRDFTTHTDDGVPYSCFATIGSLILAQQGQIAGVTFASVRAVRVGSSPTVSFLLNEITGSFTTFPSAQAYPWQIYGATLQPTSLYSNAYYFRATGNPALCEHLQIKISFPAENFQNEVLTMSLFGVVEQSPED